MKNISRHCLNVQNESELAEFYCDLLGMRVFDPQGSPAYGYDPDQCLIEFHEGATEPYTTTREDFYWKIGITVRNLDHAVRYLRQEGWPVSDPHQFRDIGYLCHIQDPQGFNIELLQQGFEGNHAPAPHGHPIGAQATLAHITLRITDIMAAKAYCEGELGMRLMSVQPVQDYEFCLYFYGWSNETLPQPDLEAVKNREWLWARPHALLELQHLETASTKVHKTGGNAAGFKRLTITTFGENTQESLTLSDLG